MVAITLQNRLGTRVTVSDIGASVCAVETADRDGRFSNIALAPLERGESASQYAYAGATLAPSAGRVPHGWLMLERERLTLSRNAGSHHLHGGQGNLSGSPWHVEGNTGDTAVFACKAKAGRDGYPGNRHFRVEYRLTQDNSLSLRMTATTDEPTWVNLSNHLYWNLSGDFSTTIADHHLTLHASHACWNDAEHIPVACQSVSGTALDFRNASLLGPRLLSGDAQLAIANGYNNCFQLDGTDAALLTHAPSGRALQLETDLPALVLYTGGYLSEALPLAGGGHAHPACALALEPQLPPITPFSRQAAFVTTPDRPYNHSITYRFLQAEF